MDAHGREVLSPAYWSCLKSYTGRFRAALLRRSACGDRAARSPTSVLYPHTGRAAAAAVGLGGPSSGCCEGPGGLPHGKPRLGATQAGPAGRPWAAGHVSTELIGLIECHGEKKCNTPLFHGVLAQPVRERHAQGGGTGTPARRLKVRRCAGSRGVHVLCTAHLLGGATQQGVLLETGQGDAQPGGRGEGSLRLGYRRGVLAVTIPFTRRPGDAFALIHSCRQHLNPSSSPT